MVEHLPPGSAWHRARRGPFDEEHLLLREIESRLRDVLVTNRAQLGALKTGLRLKGGSSQLPTPKYIPIPGPLDGDEDDLLEEVRAQERAELAALLHRN